MILIEGAPGIGKTILSKEIAFQWAHKIILNNKKLLFLLFLRDPQIKNITSVKSFVNHFCQSDSLTNKITDWLVETRGEYLTIILDGYDEMCENNKNCFIVDGIIGRQKLPKCGIIITSRPAATAHLHDVVNCRAEVLGFTEEDRQNFIHDALAGQTDKIDELGHFLTNNPFLNALCYIPLNMSILLCLTEEGINTLPKTQTNLYQKFIIMTIVHFLKKDSIKFNTTITSLHDLPHPFDHAVKELSQFAFLALQKDQLVFTLAEVRAEYPNFTPANWYGLGLLKTAQYFKPQDGCDHESFHFLHYSIQEYMAAYYITSLSNNKLLSLLQETFWNVHYFNTWIMYVGLTKGRDFVFSHFLSGKHFQITNRFLSPKISSKIISDKIKCLHLLNCSTEAGSGNNVLLSSIENILQEKIIDLSNCILSANDLRTLAVLLLRSPIKQWEKLNLKDCNIDHNGCNLLCEMFQAGNVSFKIKTIDISYNSIQWESLSKFCVILKLWQTEELILSVDALYDNWTMSEINSFTDKLHKRVNKTKIVSSRILCTYMAEQQKMVVVYSEVEKIWCFQLSDCTLIDNALITRLKVHVAEQTGIGLADTIVTLNFNINYEDGCIKSSVLSHHIGRITLCGSNMHSKGVYLMKIPFTILQEHQQPHHIAADYLAGVLCYNIQSKSSYLKAIPASVATTVENNLPGLVNLRIFCAEDNIISKEISGDIAHIFSHNTKLQELYLGMNNLQSEGIINIIKQLQGVSYLTTFDISNNKIGKEAADDIAAVLSHNIKLRHLDLYGNNLQSEGVIKVMKGLQNVSTLHSFSIYRNDVSESAADDIAIVLSHNSKLQVLYLGENKLQSKGAVKIAKGLQKVSNLTALDISHNNISTEAADDIAALLSHNTNLEELYLGGNNLQSAGALKVAKGLQNVLHLRTLTMHDNYISEAAWEITTVLCHNTKLENLYLGGNDIQSAGAIMIAKSLQNVFHLTIFSICDNNINEEAARDIAAVLSHNTELQKLYLGKNNLQSMGAIMIAKGLQNISNLIIFSISDNNIGEEAADDIATALFHNINLQEIYLDRNNLQSVGATKIAESLLTVIGLTVCDISNNNISEEAADNITIMLSHNTKAIILYR